MKNTFYRPAQVNICEFEKIIKEMQESLSELVAGQSECEEVIHYVKKLIADGKPLPKNPNMIFWGLAEPDTMPSDARVEFFYMPTYLAVSILAYIRMYGPFEALQLKGFDETLRKGLLGATGREFNGSGHDALEGLIKTMDIFTKAHLHEFVLSYPEICPKFTGVFLHVKKGLEDRLQAGKILGDWGEDYTVEAADVIRKMKDFEGQSLMFVYGTLLYGNCNHDYYLSNSKYLGEGVLHGYALYDLGSFPGVKTSNSDYVKGEVYSIDSKTLERINHLEGEGSLYSLKKRTIEMGGELVPEVGVYVYLHDVKGKDYVEPENQPWGKNVNEKENLVWYAAYGSNMLYERFLCYINGGSFRKQSKPHNKCLDTTPPRARMSYEIPHDMYYGNQSGSWNRRGVSFLDVTKPGRAYGVAYLITREQFNHLYREENGGSEPGPHSLWYNHKAELGSYHGIPVKTITNLKIVEKNEADQKYIDVLWEGLRQNYPNLSDEKIQDYLHSRNI